jgi:calcineurin-like phosphoesterase family protein
MRVDATNTWISSDLHFFHKNILKFQPNRGNRWANADEMNAWIVNHINETVGPNGVFIHLGDLTFGRYDETVELLSGIKVKEVHSILGNHDDDQHMFNMCRRLSSVGYTKWWMHGERLTLKFGKNEEMVCDHFALQVWNKSHYGVMHVHGHTHGSLSNEGYGRRCDVGFDSPHVTGEPANRIFRLDEVAAYLMARPIAWHDHHKPKQ